jgi:hypothetical protein
MTPCPLKPVGNCDLQRAPIPLLAEAEVNPSRAWAGLYEMTQDHHPILGKVPSVEGFCHVLPDRTAKTKPLLKIRPSASSPDIHTTDIETLSPIYTDLRYYSCSLTWTRQTKEMSFHAFNIGCRASVWWHLVPWRFK